MSAEIKIVNVKSTESFFIEAPKVAGRAMRLAINTVAHRGALSLAKQRISKEINFPNGYLGANRLNVTQDATESRLEAVISGRDRPTSLARFQTYRSASASRGKQLKVQVKRGQTRTLNRAFLVTLNNGNLGLAIRTPNKPKVAYKPVPLANNLWLLYGVSVDQAFGVVADEIAPEIGTMVEKEFDRQFIRMIGNGS